MTVVAQSIFANLIIGAPFFVYFFQLVALPVTLIAMGFEFFAFRRYQPGLRTAQCVGVLVLANVLSTLVGVVASSALPSGYARHQPASSFKIQVAFGFVFAYGWSVLIEYLVFRRFARSWPLEQPAWTAVFCNLWSYGVIAIGAVLVHLVYGAL